MADRSSHLPHVMLFLGLILLCAVVGGVYSGLMVITDKVTLIYGPPDADLGVTQRILYQVQLLRYQKDLTTPVEFQGGEPRGFQIEMGTSVPAIASRLEAEQFVLNGEAFQTYLVYSGLDQSIQAGQYQLSSGLNAIGMAQALQDATPAEVAFGVLAGWRLEEIAAALSTSGLQITAEEFLTSAQKTEILGDYEWGMADSAEGFILSTVYQIPRSASAEEMLRYMLDTFESEITPELRTGWAQQGLSVEEAVILASIVQKEAVIVEEQPMIASVFLNRLRVGMRLESDPTVQYAVGYDATQQTWWKNPLTTADLQVNSPYNTYLYAGLTPGAICSPSLGALQAVALPAETPYYFFRARCDNSGYHEFAITYEEHLQNACP